MFDIIIIERLLGRCGINGKKILTLLISVLEVYKMLILGCMDVGASKDANRTIVVSGVQSEKSNLRKIPTYQESAIWVLLSSLDTLNKSSKQESIIQQTILNSISTPCGRFESKFNFEKCFLRCFWGTLDEKRYLWQFSNRISTNRGWFFITISCLTKFWDIFDCGD